eukprot:TRINITY_DN3065_c0_g5_i4.p1 TRINITY_DN3065_c0_g5~~TRINITY_DN3065_c0_g5_i4.p1  ORF type:complete len:484 (+),score=7.65 TRINITY_DN3065_c0_g5_i4:960-2411(+)
MMPCGSCCAGPPRRVPTPAPRRSPRSMLSSCVMPVSPAAVAPPGYAGNVPFVVVEERDGALRLRFILWTKGANDALADVYQPEVPLHHVSEYLSAAATSEVASLRDLATSFYQIELPEHVRKYFAFQDAQGNWFELNRLPMGHTCAPELMHSLTSTIAHHPSYVSAEHVLPGVKIESFVDNIRISGARAAVAAATSQVDAEAAAAGVTWKPADSRNEATVYTFLGVVHDHAAQTVVISESLRVKMASALDGSMTYAAAEQLGGRLVHASAVAGEHVGKHYFALKLLRRVCNALNSGRATGATSLELTPRARDALSRWVAAVSKPRTVTVAPSDPEATLFVDASLSGFGAVLATHATMGLTIIGDRWGAPDKGSHINYLEARALHVSLHSLPVQQFSRIAILVDSTTVQGAARKGACLKNENLNTSIIEALGLLKKHNIAFSLKYISSSSNPSDLPSRVPVVRWGNREFDDVVQATRRFFRTSS